MQNLTRRGFLHVFSLGLAGLTGIGILLRNGRSTANNKSEEAYKLPPDSIFTPKNPMVTSDRDTRKV